MSFRGSARGRGTRNRGGIGSRGMSNHVTRFDNNMFAVLSSQDGDSDILLSDSDDGESHNARFEDVRSRKSKRQRMSSGGRSNLGEQVSDADFDFDTLSSDEKLSAMFNKLMQVEQKVDCVQSLSTRVSKAETVIKSHENRLKLLEYKSIDIESRSRRRNLIFWGIAESPVEAKDTATPYKLVHNFIRVDLGIERVMFIERAHRLGRFKPGVCRPIIAAFRDYPDTEEIMSNARKLKGTLLRVNRDYPSEIVEARRALYPMYKEYRDQNKYNKVSIQYPAKLVVNGAVIRDMFPDWSEIMSGFRVDSRQLFTSIDSHQKESMNVAPSTGTTSNLNTGTISIGQASGAQINPPIETRENIQVNESQSSGERSSEEGRAIAYRPWSSSKPLNESDTSSTTKNTTNTILSDGLNSTSNHGACDNALQPNATGSGVANRDYSQSQGPGDPQMGNVQSA